MAPPPGFKADIAVQEYRKDTNGLYAYARYAWGPPDRGIMLPNSANELSYAFDG